ncbi:cobalamin-binding protein [Tissierella creatinini]|nr:cobalamin-binding protein [Tissierella creatinini]TJX64593.1 cobalamin-binding protein [Soehngenia saccharolytica]
MTKEGLLKRLSDCVVDMEEDLVIDVAKEYVEAGFDPQEGIMDGLVDGMKRASVLFDEEEYYIPELLSCSDAMNAGIAELQSHMSKAAEGQSAGKVVLAVVHGDTHDIGKDLLRIMLETNGFTVIDVGRDVPSEKIVDVAVENGADIIALSSLMTTTMPNMKQVIDITIDRGIRNDFKIIVGGAPISQKYADSIGADGYSSNAIGAVNLVKSLLGVA